MTALPSLRQQLAQLFLLGFKGDSLIPTAALARYMGELGLGGVILFDRHLASGSDHNNITSPSQLQALISSLQDRSRTKLLAAVDQEGGRVSRFRQEHGFPTTPSARSLGEEGLAATAASSRQTALLLKEMGINLNLAPVSDLDRNPDNPIIGGFARAFASDPEEVAAHCQAWIAEHTKLGILSCLKHFPGHGSSVDDSHHGFVDISQSWHPKELLPYERLLQTEPGLGVMLGHLFCAQLDAKFPATLSSTVINQLLRGELGYQGPVISDDMQMKAITARYGLEEACCRAVAAGVDLLVVGNNLAYEEDLFPRLLKALEKGLEDGILTEERVAEAYTRVITFRNQAG